MKKKKKKKKSLKKNGKNVNRRRGASPGNPIGLPGGTINPIYVHPNNHQPILRGASHGEIQIEQKVISLMLAFKSQATLTVRDRKGIHYMLL